MWVRTFLRRDKKDKTKPKNDEESQENENKKNFNENDKRKYQAELTEGEVHLSLMSLAGLLICLSCLLGVVLLLNLQPDFAMEQNLQLTPPQLGLC